MPPTTSLGIPVPVPVVLSAPVMFSLSFVLLQLSGTDVNSPVMLIFSWGSKTTKTRDFFLFSSNGCSIVLTCLFSVNTNSFEIPKETDCTVHCEQMALLEESAINTPRIPSCRSGLLPV